ncbi:phage GP46 family protein [Desulfovibrio sp. OttesenSCG-928-C06]|nr:phage GP46 family protein [Desulfovibrio sp. OttesenSCG-928-C06]
MPGIALLWQKDKAMYDMAFESTAQGADYLGDPGLLTAITISLFTNRHAAEADILPDAAVGQKVDPQGWWGDYLAQTGEMDEIGSRLWLLRRELDQDSVVARADVYAKEALAWLTTAKAGRLRVSALHVAARRISRGYLGIEVGSERLLEDALRRENWLFTYDYKNAEPLDKINYFTSLTQSGA